MVELSEEQTIRVTAMQLALDSFERIIRTEDLIDRAKCIEKFIKEGEEE